MDMAIEAYISNLCDGCGDLLTRWYDYNSGYICDIISEIADSAISIYTQDQIDYANENTNAVDEAIAEGLVSFDAEVRSGYDFRDMVASAGVAAWYLDNTNQLWNDVQDGIRYVILVEMERLGFTDLNDAQVEYLDNEHFDEDGRLENIIEIAIEELSMLRVAEF